MNPQKLNIIYSKLEYIILYLNHMFMDSKNNNEKYLSICINGNKINTIMFGGSNFMYLCILVVQG